MIISHLSPLNRINVNTSTRITEPVSTVCQGRRFRGVCGGINRDYTVRRLSARTLTTFRPSRCQERARWPMRSGSPTVSDEEEQVVGSPMAQVATNMPLLRPGQPPLRPLLIAPSTWVSFNSQFSEHFCHSWISWFIRIGGDGRDNRFLLPKRLI